jgi:hypothetical protein
MVQDAINEINIVIQGTVNQAKEDVRLLTRHQEQDTRQENCPETRLAKNLHNPGSQEHAIPSVTPKQTFRGHTVRIDDPSPRQEHYSRTEDPQESYNSRHQAE